MNTTNIVETRSTTLILVVDDTHSMLETIKEFLSIMLRSHYSNLQVLTAENGTEALRLIAKNIPDIIITDFHMPDMTGVQLIRKIRQTIPKIPVIFMSGEPDQEIISTVKEISPHFLQKPFEPFVLTDTVKTLLPQT